MLFGDEILPRWMKEGLESVRSALELKGVEEEGLLERVFNGRGKGRQGEP